ncbi:MAG: isoprenylcysteine carboxylmethyltransferase family protein [Candidatus Eremiobacteraeota bacterium]|nr:isoprenylcysteine carboxylmethyltransferase family protein [Candidatus Eremiobacteraeota bacterium]
MKGLSKRAWSAFARLALAMGLLVFLTAGSLRYFQAWGFLAVFFGASFLITRSLLKNDPALLERRLKSGPAAEKEKTQRIIMLFASLGFIALLVVPALDFRFHWSRVPLWLVIAGDGAIVLGFLIVFRVLRENPFTSATIEIASDQRVISTGPYATVRHPMYAGSMLYHLGMPFALGSYWGLLALAGMVPFLIWRLFDEERFLSASLPGYRDYCSTVRWRLIPGIF